MRISDLIKMGIRNLSRRKARTFLTILGVIIGTLSIVIMVSIGIGMNNSFDINFMIPNNAQYATVIGAALHGIR